MRAVFARSARRQVEQIIDGIAAKPPQGARRVRARIKAVADLLADHPRSGRATEIEGVGRVPVVLFPYLIFDRVTLDAVIIQYVRHGARDPSGPLDD